MRMPLSTSSSCEIPSDVVINVFVEMNMPYLNPKVDTLMGVRTLSENVHPCVLSQSKHLDTKLASHSISFS
jgi:hypothetical protein